MKEIGIIVCNYNKQDFILNCIQSILESSINNFDIYVVDNASTDDSVNVMKEKFHDKINLIINDGNLGGSGGFNRGIRAALEKNYKYIMLVDNDVVMDKYAVEKLVYFLDEHNDVGIVGSKIYFMDYPDRIQTYGAGINFDNYIYEDYHRNCIDYDELPKVQYCDYVPACSLLARTEVIRKVGIMPESNFIYWDDMEWGYRFGLAGYKVAAYSESKVWHKGGGRTAKNTFINYYMWRNRFNFFIKYISKEKREHFADTILSELFRMIYSCNLKGEYNIIKSVMYAYDDALNGVRGKASEYKILNRNEIKNRLRDAIGDASSIIILFNDDYEALGNIVRDLKNINSDLLLFISMQKSKYNVQQVQEMFPECEVKAEYNPEKYDFHLKMCDHIFNLTTEKDNDIYIDAWCNIIYSEDDFIYCNNFKNSLQLFLRCHKDLLINRIIDAN